LAGTRQNFGYQNLDGRDSPDPNCFLPRFCALLFTHLSCIRFPYNSVIMPGPVDDTEMRDAPAVQLSNQEDYEQEEAINPETERNRIRVVCVIG
jgi:hypothetical protein